MYALAPLCGSNLREMWALQQKNPQSENTSSPKTSTGFQGGQKLRARPAADAAAFSFAQSVVARLRQKLSLWSCVLTLPPRCLMGRLYLSRQSQMHMRRLSSNLGGRSIFSKHGALQLSIALWAGISAGGSAAASYAKNKLTNDQ